MNEKSDTSCGYIALVGAPNAGKSTLLNRMVGAKISIVSPKVQTTRHRILGVLTEGKSQFVFIDTPGIFNAKKPFEKAMVKAALSGAREADVVLLMVDAQKGVCDDTRMILEELQHFKKPRAVVINKVDAIDKGKLPALAEELFKGAMFEECFMISAMKNDGIADIIRYLKNKLPAGPWLFPEDQLTDQPMQRIATEITREQVFYLLRQELPYSIAVENEKWEEKKDGTTKISQVIYVETEGQKKIVLGAKGAMLKKIGERSRRQIGDLLGHNVHLFLFVKVKEDWKNRREFYDDIGLEFK